MRLAQLPLPDLEQRLAGLAADSDVLQNLQERAQLRAMLRDLGLESLLADLAERHVPEEQVAAELELAWWRSALESLLESDRALLGANTSVLDRLEADFKLVDEAHAAGSAGLLGWQLAENWNIGLVDWPEEATELKRVLRRRTPDHRRPARRRTAPVPHHRPGVAGLAVRGARASPTPCGSTP